MTSGNYIPKIVIPTLDYETLRYSSIRYDGAPLPCGIYMTKTKQYGSVKIAFTVNGEALCVPSLRSALPLPLVFKYSLSSETLYVRGQKREYSHIFLMAHVTTALIDELIYDLSQPGAFPTQEEEQPELETDIYVTHKPKKLIHVPHTGRGFK